MPHNGDMNVRHVQHGGADVAMKPTSLHGGFVHIIIVNQGVGDWCIQGWINDRGLRLRPSRVGRFQGILQYQQIRVLLH